MRTYSEADKDLWDHFVDASKNATFLFKRDFMEYHQDRFDDFSLMVFKSGKPVALLPAHRIANQLYSHNGLTYGGVVLKRESKLKEVLYVFKQLLVFLSEQGFTLLTIKELPSIYRNDTAEELDYLSFILKGKIVRVDVSGTIDLSHPLKIQKNRMEGVKKALKNQLTIREEEDFSNFWNEILIPNIRLRHDAKPVHSVEEIMLLKRKFPNHIKQFNVYHNNAIVGGATLFEMPNLVHVQYISANENRQELGALDFLFHYLIEERYSKKKYFDFGTSNENKGQNINDGLLYWKECFGARTIVHRYFEIDIENHPLLDSVFL